MLNEFIRILNFLYSDVISNKMVDKYCMVFISCLIGLIAKDIRYANQNKYKLNIFNMIVSAVPVTILMSAVNSIVCSIIDVKANDIWVLAYFMSGIWSREIITMLMNTKIMVAVLKAYAKMVISKLPELEEDQVEDLQKKVEGELDAIDTEVAPPKKQDK